MDTSRARRLLALTAVTLLVAATPATTPAALVEPLGPEYFSSGNATLDLNIPVHWGTAGSRSRTGSS